MVSELVETSRLWGRTAAKIDPRWVEPLAEHLVRRTYDDPRWEKRRASVVATERVTLYGLPIVAGRAIPYGAIDPVLSRDLFIRRALVEGEWDTRHRFLAANQELIEEVEALEERARRRDILVDEQTLYDFYSARIPESIVSGAHFDRWWRDERRLRPDLLTFTRELLINPAAAEDVRGRPDTWVQGENELKLTYRFQPGTAQDGVTVHVPLKLLPQLRSEGFEWLVPALRAELITALLRSLPKELRKRLVPVPDVTTKVLDNLKAAPTAAARSARGGDRAAARRPHRAHRLGRLPPAHLPEDDVQRRGRAGQGDRLRPGSERLARAGAAEAARCAPAGDPQARADRPDDVDVREDPQGRRTARHGPDDPRLPVIGRRGTDGRRARPGERGGPGAEHARGHAAAADADDPLPRPRLPEQARQPGARSR